MDGPTPNNFFDYFQDVTTVASTSLATDIPSTSGSPSADPGAVPSSTPSVGPRTGPSVVSSSTPVGVPPNFGKLADPSLHYTWKIDFSIIEEITHRQPPPYTLDQYHRVIYKNYSKRIGCTHSNSNGTYFLIREFLK